MLLTDAEIKEEIKSGKIFIEPLSKDCFRGVAYVARLGARALVGGEDSEKNIEATQSLVLEAGEFALFTTLERFKLSDRIAGHLGIRTDVARKGLVLLQGMHVDPGWEGHLVLGGYNASSRRLVLDYEAELVSIEFHKLAMRPERLARVSNEQREGRIPDLDKDYLRARTMGTQSLGQLSKDLVALREVVFKMDKRISHLSTQMGYLLWGLPFVATILCTGVALIAVMVALK